MPKNQYHEREKEAIAPIAVQALKGERKVDPNRNVYKLSDYLLSHVTLESQAKSYPEARTLSDKDLQKEINDIVHKLKPFVEPQFTGYRSHQQVSAHLPERRNNKADFFVENVVYDKFLKGLLKEYLVISISLLRRIYAMHSAQVLYGNICPESFVFDRTDTKVFRNELGVVFSDKGVVQSEGDSIYVKTNIRVLNNIEYIAPELQEAIMIYEMKQRLHDLLLESDHRELDVAERAKVEKALRDYQQTFVKYSDKAEIYSVGYTLNVLLSHLLTKLVLEDLQIYEFPDHEHDYPIIEIADQLLPDQFANPGDTRLLKLLNETVAAVYLLMQPKIDKRDTVKGSLEKFRSILRRLLEEPPTVIHDTSDSALILQRIKSGKR